MHDCAMSDALQENALPAGSLALATGTTGFTSHHLLRRLRVQDVGVHGGFETRIKNKRGIPDVARWYVENGWLERASGMHI